MVDDLTYESPGEVGEDGKARFSGFMYCSMSSGSAQLEVSRLGEVSMGSSGLIVAMVVSQAVDA